MTEENAVHRCAWCKRIFFNGSWIELDDKELFEEYKAVTTDGICDVCQKKHFPGYEPS